MVLLNINLDEVGGGGVKFFVNSNFNCMDADDKLEVSMDGSIGDMQMDVSASVEQCSVCERFTVGGEILSPESDKTSLKSF